MSTQLSINIYLHPFSFEVVLVIAEEYRSQFASIATGKGPALRFAAPGKERQVD